MNDESKYIQIEHAQNKDAQIEHARIEHTIFKINNQSGLSLKSAFRFLGWVTPNKSNELHIIQLYELFKGIYV